MRVRDAEVDDALACAELLDRVISSLEIYSDEARRREVAKYREPALSDIIANGIGVVAEDSGQIVGTCIGYDDDALIWLSWFVVEEDFRRRGLTWAMLQRFLSRAQLVTHKVWCDCRTTNEASIRLLERAGFEKIASIDRHWYGQDFILWQKYLES